MSRSALSAARRSQINAVNVCLFLWITTKKSPFLPPHRPYVILAIGAGVLVVVFLFYFLITRGNPPKDVLFFGNEHGSEPFATRFPNALTLQLNPGAATFCRLISQVFTRMAPIVDSL